GTRLERMTWALVEQVIELVVLERATQRWIQLALEPEPGCLLETSHDVVQFFEQHLFTASVAAHVAAACGVAPGAALDLVRRHLGVCVDTCHLAVEFEEPDDAVAVFRAAGISIAKLQLSSGLRVCPITDVAL